MAFQKKWTGKRKKEKPNQLRQNPTISFRTNLHPKTLEYLKRLSTTRKRTEFINQAIEMKFFSLTNIKQFLKQVIQEHYNLCRYLLRKIGREKKIS